MSFTYKPKKKKRAKKHGFLSRSKTAAGKKTILRRRRKGRVALSTVKQKQSIK
jgi:large subunit ribosomal protein L34